VVDRLGRLSAGVLAHDAEVIDRAGNESVERVDVIDDELRSERRREAVRGGRAVLDPRVGRAVRRPRYYGGRGAGDENLDVIDHERFARAGRRFELPVGRLRRAARPVARADAEVVDRARCEPHKLCGVVGDESGIERCEEAVRRGRAVVDLRVGRVVRLPGHDG